MVITEQEINMMLEKHSKDRNIAPDRWAGVVEPWKDFRENVGFMYSETWNNGNLSTADRKMRKELVSEWRVRWKRGEISKDLT